MTENEGIIREALTAWNIPDAEAEIIRHNENITCKVLHGDEKCALRIHQPKKGFQTSLITDRQNDTALFQSEAQLLLHLSRNGFDGLQNPLQNRNGEYISVLSGGIPAMLLTWVEGEPLTPEEGPAYAGQIGELICRIHRAARGFLGKRFAYDNALCDRMIREINRAVSLGHLKESAAARCAEELEAVKLAQQRLAAEDPPSVIHSDLSFGNILRTDRGLIPIDFSLSGYGSLAQEAGMAMSNYQDENSCVMLLEGIAACGMRVDRADADLFLSYSVLLFICAQHDRFHAETWFQEAMDRWCGELFIHDST